MAEKFPSDTLTWRDALAIIPPVPPSPTICNCGRPAETLRHLEDRYATIDEDEDGKFVEWTAAVTVETFTCQQCLDDDETEGLYLWTGDGYEPWENIVDAEAFGDLDECEGCGEFVPYLFAGRCAPCRRKAVAA